MKPIKWTSSLNIDDGLIDEDHRSLLDIINNVRSSLKRSETGEQTLKLLSRLREYTQYHFAREEELQKVAGYPLHGEHAKLHVLMVGQLDELIQEVKHWKDENLNPDIVNRTSDFLRGWLFDHIWKHDLKMKPYIEAMKQPPTGSKDQGALKIAPTLPEMANGNENGAQEKPASSNIELTEAESSENIRFPDNWEFEITEKRKSSQAQTLDLDGIVEKHRLWLESKGSEGERAILDGLNLVGADLSGKNLNNASLRECDLSDADCSEAILDGCDLRQTILSGARMEDCNLSVSKLRHAKMDLCLLSRANLRGADLAGVTFRGANVEAVDFTGANLLETDFSEVDLKGTQGLMQKQIDMACVDATTRLPTGVRMPRNE